MTRIYANPEKLQYPKDATLTDILFYHNLNNTPSEKSSVIDGYTGKAVFTYASFGNSVRKVARHFSYELGIGQRTVVGILSSTKVRRSLTRKYPDLLLRPRTNNSTFAELLSSVCTWCTCGWGVVSAYNPTYEPKVRRRRSPDPYGSAHFFLTELPQELAHALKLSKPSHVFVEAALLPSLLKAFAQSPALRPRPGIHVWDTHDLNKPDYEPLKVEEIIQHGCPDFEPARLPPGAAAKEQAFICFSSGTSGLVKGVQLTHESVVANIFQHSQGIRGMFNPKTVVTLIVPFFHVLGLAGFCCQFICQVSKSFLFVQRGQN